MNTFLKILLSVVILAAVYYIGRLWAMSHQPVTNENFEMRMDSLDARMDDFEVKLDSIMQLENNLQDSLRDCKNTLQKGQKVIYDEVKTKEEKSFFQKLFN